MAGSSARLAIVQRLVAQPVPTSDPEPSMVGERIFIGNKYHAKDVEKLVSLGVTAVLNCASSGIRNLPLDVYEACGIDYNFTNVAQDAHTYPILHSTAGEPSDHIETAIALYKRVCKAGGKVMFFCVAGQNRSATLAVAVQLVADGLALEHVLSVCARTRPFILENTGFQQQLLELEARLLLHREGDSPPGKRPRTTLFAPSDLEPAPTSLTSCS